jgi:RNA polymerase sigma factor for flagellar operon FliA
MISADAIDLVDERQGPDQAVFGGETRECLALGIRALPKRQALVLWLYYYEELPLREIADALEVTPSRVCQIRTEAVERLRKHLSEQEQRLAA